MNLYSRALEPNLWKDLLAYFEFGGNPSGCWGMNHRLPMGCDFDGEPAKLALEQLVEQRKVFGLLAYSEGEDIPVGWCALDRKETIPGHDCVGTDINCGNSIWSIHCLTSRSDFKEKGVEDFLSQEAVKLAREYRATELEAYPEPDSHSDQPFTTWNSFSGYQSCFRELGFELSKEVDQFFCTMRKKL